MMKKLQSIGDVRAAGIDTSQYMFIDNDWYLPLCDAVVVVGYNHKRKIGEHFVPRAVERGELIPLRRGRWLLYPLNQLLKLRAKTPGRRSLPDEKMKPSSLYRRQLARQRLRREWGEDDAV
jgi:hypothetical protein